MLSLLFGGGLLIGGLFTLLAVAWAIMRYFTYYRVLDGADDDAATFFFWSWFLLPATAAGVFLVYEGAHLLFHLFSF